MSWGGRGMDLESWVVSVVVRVIFSGELFWEAILVVFGLFSVGRRYEKVWKMYGKCMKKESENDGVITFLSISPWTLPDQAGMASASAITNRYMVHSGPYQVVTSIIPLFTRGICSYATESIK